MLSYQENFFPKTVLTRILGIPTYDSLHQIQIDLNKNAFSVQTNLGGSTNVSMGIFMTNTKNTTLSKVPYVRPVNPVILLIQKKQHTYHHTRLSESTTIISKFYTKYADMNRP